LIALRSSEFFKMGSQSGPNCDAYGTCKLICLGCLHALIIVVVKPLEF
jgi:hypothetical protein